MAKGLYRADGTFQPFDAASLATELATRQNAGITFGELESWLNILPDPDPVLRKRGDDSSVLADLSADDQVATAMLSRKNRVLNCPDFTLRPGSPDGEEPTAQAKKLYEAFTGDLERCNLRDIISAILDAPFFGFSPLELVWKRGGDCWHLADIVARPCRWFAFDNANNPVFTGAYGALCAQPVELPAGKFVIVRHHANYDNPYGLRLLSRCLWPVAFKRGGLSFYSRFVERHGMPWVIGEAPAKAERAEKQEMAQSLSRMVQDAVAVVPCGANVKLESASQTQTDLHEKFLSRMDKAISKILMGQTLTVEMEGKNSQAAAQTHQDVAEGLADADKAMVVDAWNEIAWIYARVNSGPGVMAPLASYEEPEDLNSRADLDKKLTEIGVRFTAEHFKENYGLKETEFSVAGGESPPGGDAAEFAASLLSMPVSPQGGRPYLYGGKPPTATLSRQTGNGHGPLGRHPVAPADKIYPADKAQAKLDAAIVKLLPKALSASADFVTQVENAVRKAKSFDDLSDSLVELLQPAMRPQALETFLAQALTAAAGYGASAVQGEIEADS